MISCFPQAVDGGVLRTTDELQHLLEPVLYFSRMFHYFQLRFQ
jgi:hypothetical protein